MNASLEGRTAIVTGGAQGIGRASVSRFLSEGANVAFFDIDETEGQRAATAADAGDRVLFVHCDLRSEAAVAAAVSRVTERFGGIDVLVNNAGMRSFAPATTVDGFEQMMGTNHLGPFLLTNLLRDLLRAAAQARVLVRAQQTRGLVIKP